MSSQNEVTFAEMFCGIGGFRFGLEKANEVGIDSQSRIRNEEGRCESLIEGSDGRVKQEFRCVWANDIDKYASQIYRKHYGNKELVEGDIRTIDPDSIPDFDLLTAGFPCQSFSLAGKRKGFQDIRGTLFHEIVRVAGIKRPRFLLLENVKGLLSNDDGKTFGTILEELGNIRYWVEWQTLNSKHFGVPQNRERVFIVGHSREGNTKPIFPLRQTCKISARKRENKSESFEALTLEANYGKNKSLHNMFLTPEIAGSLTGGAHSGGLHSQMTVLPCLTPDRPTKRQHGRRFKESGGEMFTLTDQDIHGIAYSEVSNTLCDGWLMSTEHHNKPMNQYRIRRLTPVECERLQAFPDGWTKYGTIYKSVQPIGNIWQLVNVPSKIAVETSLSESQNYVLCITSVGKNGVTQNSLTLLPEYLWQKQNANTAIGLAKIVLEKCVDGITNLGSAMVMLSKQNETSSIEQLTKKNLISERMAEKSTYPLLNLQLEENCPKVKLSIILTSIRETIESKTFTFSQTEKPIINVMVHLKKLPNRFSQRELLSSQRESIVEISDTQRYKLLGNAVTSTVIEFLGTKLLEAEA